LSHQGLPVAEIARTLGISRPTVRKYRDGVPRVTARRPKRSKLDPYKDQMRRWVEQDHCTNCVSMLERLRPLGYTGGLSQLKAFVHPLRRRSGRLVDAWHQRTRGRAGSREQV
jgi:transposase